MTLKPNGRIWEDVGDAEVTKEWKYAKQAGRYWHATCLARAISAGDYLATENAGRYIETLENGDVADTCPHCDKPTRPYLWEEE